MFRKKLLPILVLFTSFCSSCEKSGIDCPAKGTVTVAANYQTITQGWDLKLSADYNSLYRYLWTGPNGWTMETTAAVVTRVNMQMQDAGNYSVRVFNSNNCEVYVGSLAVTVAPVQTSPCDGTLTNNTCTSDIFGLPTFTYTNIYFGNHPTNQTSSVSCYPAVPGNTNMSFTFLGHMRPRPGLYKTIYGYNAFREENEVSMYLYNPATGKHHITSFGYNVYVNLVNGKTQISFCNIEVRDAPSGNLNYISGKLTITN